MLGRIAFSLIAVSMALSNPVMAREPGFFAGLDVSGVKTFGSSDTHNGGASWAGGGVVKNVDFDDAAGIGGHVGYRFNDAWSAFVSYQYVRGDVSWDADFPGIGATSNFSGSATTNAILGNVAYDLALSSATTARVTAGMGVSFNSLSGVVEKDQGTSLFLSDVEDHTETSLIAQLGLGLRHEVTKSVVLGLDASVAYIGSFRTGDTRSGNLGVTDITPYKIDDVWRASLGATVQVVF
jgi:hypothetical protein